MNRALKLLSALLLIIFSHTALHAQNKTEHQKPNPLLKRLDNVFNQAKIIAKNNLIVCIATVCCTGESPFAIINHYQELFSSIQENVDVDNNNFGDGMAGYFAATKLYTEENLKLLENLYPKAMRSYKGEDETWQDWLSNFSTKEFPKGDPNLALLAIDMNLHTTVDAIGSYKPTEQTEKMFTNFLKLVRNFNRHSDMYSVGKLNQNKFGVDLNGPKSDLLPEASLGASRILRSANLSA